MSAVVLTAGLVAHATKGHLASGPGDRVFTHVSTDTRTLQPGALFVALRGEHFDGHAFVERALAAGAGGLVLSDPPSDRTGEAAVILVPDTLVALQNLARDVRRRSAARVVAITGSAGKTTTKEVTGELLGARYTVFRNRGNLNNHIGLPLSLLELVSGPDIAVVELGMNHEGEIRTLVGIAEPDVRVWTNVGDAHFGHFGSSEAVASAKSEILEGATADTLVVSNADDALVSAHVERTRARRVTFGFAPHATVRAARCDDRGFAGTTAEVQTPQGPLRLDVPLAGRAQLMNVLAATAVALDFGIPASDIERRVSSLTAVARRGAVHVLPNGARIVDDSYNASPSAVRAMLNALAVTPVQGQRIAVLGEMLELGPTSRHWHEQCGRTAATSGVRTLVVIGGEAADGLVDGAIAAGLSPGQIHRFTDSAAAAARVPQLVGADDLVLVKGSRGTRTDLVVDRLLAVA